METQSALTSPRYFRETWVSFDNDIRWTDWAKNILGRLDDPQAIHDEVVARGKESDIEAEEADELLLAIENRVATVGYSDDASIWISNDAMFKIAKDLLPGQSKQSVIQRVHREITKGAIDDTSEASAQPGSWFCLFENNDRCEKLANGL